jgi:mRNA interferase MazF
LCYTTVTPNKDLSAPKIGIDNTKTNCYNKFTRRRNKMQIGDILKEKIGLETLSYAGNLAEETAEACVLHKEYKKEYRRGQVYWAYLTGSKHQQRGMRPVIIIQNNVGNQYSPNVIVAVFSAQTQKCTLPTQAIYELDSPSVLMCEYITTIPKENLKGFIRKLSKEEMEGVDTLIAKSLGLIRI